MKINIRNKVFETNSSSSHALIIKGITKEIDEEDYWTDVIFSGKEIADIIKKELDKYNVINNTTYTFLGIDKDGKIMIKDINTDEIKDFSFDIIEAGNG